MSDENEPLFDRQFKQRLLLIGVILAVLIAFYYIASPYENCARDYKKSAARNGYPVSDTDISRTCQGAPW